MLKYLILSLIGCICGVITGLTPGLHVNTVCLIGLSLYTQLGLDVIEFSIVMVSMAITQNFLDFIPAIFIGVPEESTALSILPTHRLLMQGKALEAVKLTAYGSLLGLVYAIALLIPAAYFIPLVYKSIRGIMVYIVIVASAVLILREKEIKKIFWALLIFCVSGYFGLLTLNLKIISATHVLFPVFSGLFGLSNILVSIKDKPVRVPQHESVDVKIDRQLFSSSFLGCVGGILVGVLPAMSPSQVGVLIYDIVGTNTRGFLVSVSAINTSDAIYSLVSLYTIDNPRSGVATMLGQIITLDLNTLLLFVGVISFIAAFATLIHLAVGRLAIKFFDRVDYRKVNITVMLAVVGLVYYITGWFGLFLVFISTSIGLLPIKADVSRTHLMGVLIVPTILYFLG